MIIDTIRIITDALTDGSIGVNAQLGSVAHLLAEDEPPAKVVLIADETRNNTVALRTAPRDVPALLVTIDDSVDVTSTLLTSSRVQDASISLVIHYIGAQLLTDVGRTDYYHTMRAVQSALLELFSDGNEYARSRNGTLVLDFESMTLVEPNVFKESNAVSGGMRLTVRVRETLC